jgi:hypothetical protein
MKIFLMNFEVDPVEKKLSQCNQKRLNHVSRMVDNTTMTVGLSEEGEEEEEE